MNTLIGSIGDLHVYGGGLRKGMDQCLEWARDKYLEMGCSHVILPGDIFSKEMIGDTSMTTGGVLDSFRRHFHSDQLQYIMVSGNHDRKGVGRGSAIHSLESPNIKKIVSPEQFDLNELVRVYALPWGYESEASDFRAWLKEKTQNLDPDRVNIFVAHCRVAGLEDNDGFPYDPEIHGGFWVSQEDLRDFDHIILGDFHHYQEVFKGKGGYKGIITQDSFSDEGCRCGTEIIEVTDSKKIETTWIDCPHARYHKTLSYDLMDTDFSAIKSEVKKYKDELGYIVKIKHPFDSSDEAKTRQFELERRFPNCTVDPVQVVTEQNDETTEKLEVVDDPEAALNFWNRVKENSPDKCKSLNLALEKVLPRVRS